MAGRLLADLGVDVVKVDLHADPRLGHAGFFVPVEHPVVEGAPLEGHAFRLPECPARWGRAPLRGEHTARVFRDWLGLDEGDIARLSEARVLW